jgi:hypothetical protein
MVEANLATMGDYAGSGAQAAFDPEPSLFRETGDSTGIFQVVIEIPDTLVGELLDRGEQIDLEYDDWGPAGADYVGQESESIGLTVYTSNFGATIELDQKVYTWTDLVYITIVAPDHNFDSGLVDEIGNTANDPIKVATSRGSMYGYVKDVNRPMQSFLSPKTKIKNLLFTGQSLNMHGILGVTIGAVVTCSEILGKDYLLNKVLRANGEEEIIVNNMR